MASFTDTRISNFNPYIQQLPVSEMTNVGMEKQKRYDEGIQKIQTQVDNVAGLDIMRDVDKQYLQSKLNNLKGTLKGVAAGDFSNFQLTNSVGGMINQIAKDKTIQNAVSSTMRVRQEQSKLQDAQKVGKSSVNREYDLNKGINDWMNDTTAGQLYTGKFTEHVDVNKKVLDILDKLHPNASIHDIPYAINSDGTINYKVYASAMQRQGETGVDEGQIKSAVNSMLDSNDIDELASQGRYNYKDYSPQDIQSEATRSYIQSRNSYADKLEKLQQKKLTTTGIKEQAELNNAIDYYTSLLGDSKNNIPSTLDRTHQAVLQSIISNPDGARSSLYTRNWLDNIANGFSYRDIKDEVLPNPAREDDWKRLNYNLSVLKEQHDESYRTKTLGMEGAKLDIEKSKLRLEEIGLELKEKALHPNEPSWKTKGNPATESLESMKNWTDHNLTMENSNKSIINDLVDKASTPYKKANPDNILKNIELYKDNKYVPADEYEKTQFDEYVHNSNNLATQHELYKVYEDQAYKELSGGLNVQESLNSKLKNKSNIVVADNRTGESYTFTPKEIYNYLLKERDLVQSSGIPGGGIASYQRTIGEKLSDKEQILANNLKGRYGDPRVTRIQPDAQMNNYLNSYASIMGSERDMTKKVTDLTAQKMAKITGEFKAEQTGIEFKNPEAKLNFISNISAIAEADLGEETGGINYKPKDVISLLKEKEAKNVDMQFVRQGDKYFVQVLDKTDSKDTQLVPVSEDFVNSNTNLGSSFLNKGIDFAQITLNNNGTTNIFKDYDHARYMSLDFGRIIHGVRTVTLPISADLEKKGKQVYPVFKLKDKNGKTLELHYYDPTDRTEFQNSYLPSLTDAKIIQLFKTQYPDIEQLIYK